MLVKIPIQWTLAYPATMGPDHGQISEIAGYVNYHANRIYNAAVFFLSCYLMLVQTIIFQALQASSGRNSGMFKC